MIREIKAKDGETITIRPFSLKDLGKLQQMSRLLKADTRRNYRAIPRPMPHITDFGRFVGWVIVELKLSLSSITVFRDILIHFPRFAYIAFVAVNPKGEIVGFRFFNIIGCRDRNKCIAEQGVVLRDDYQDKGIGTSFVAATLEAISGDVYIVISEIYEWNTRMIHVYERIGFRKIAEFRNESGEIVFLYARGRSTI